MNVRKTAETLETLCRKLFCVSSHEAQTGTIYLSVADERGNTGTIRIGDHGECYLPKRAEYRIDVSPTGVTVKDAEEMIRAGVASWPAVQAAPLTAGQIDRIKAEKAMLKKQKASWQALRTRLISAHGEEWIARKWNRPMARAVAAEIGEKVAITYSALTNGKKF
jgi:hypothetical protein